MQVITIREHGYRGKRRYPGDRYEAEPAHAVAYIAAKVVKLAPAAIAEPRRNRKKKYNDREMTPVREELDATQTSETEINHKYYDKVSEESD